MLCPQCRTDNSPVNRFCDACGAALAAACAACGHTNRATARYCGNCQAPLAAVDQAPSLAANLAAERKQVTILFADLVNSTALIEKLDPEQAVARLRPALDAMASGVHRYGGTVNKSRGDGIMALFGAPSGQEDHAIRACLAAVAIQNAFEPLAQSGLQARIGLHSGEVVTGTAVTDLSVTYDVNGQHVHLASRMEQIDSAPGIYLTAATLRGARTFIDVRSIGLKTIRGFSQPIEAFRLVGLRRAPASLQFRGRGHLSQFVGRDAEIALLERALEDTAGGDVRVVGIAAEAGAGKSRICFEFAERCRTRGIPVIEARALAFGQALPFEMVLGFLRDLLRIEPDDGAGMVREKISRGLAALGASLADAMPLLADFLGAPDPKQPLPPMDAGTRRARLLDFMRRLVRTAGRDRLTLILLEDLHWLDSASEAFVETVVDALPGTRVMMLLNFRPAFRAPWTDRSFYEQLPLTPLRPTAVDALLRELLGDDPSVAPLRARLSERGRGNPFFIEELARSLQEGGALAGARGANVMVGEVDDNALPETVQAVIGARIDRLAEREKSVLQTAAVIGREFAHAVLAQVAALPASELGIALERLAAAELIMELATPDPRRFAFRHPLTQEVAYLSQVMPRRRALHAAVARAIEAAERDRGDENAGLIAHHRELAGETLQAAMDWTRAAIWIGASDPGQALTYWKKIRTLLQTQPKSLPTDRLRMMAAGQVVNFGWRQGIAAEEAKDYFEEAVGLAVEAADLRAQTLILAAYGRILAASGAADQYVARVEEALAMAHDPKDASLSVTLNSVLCQAYRMAGRLGQSLAANDRALGQIDLVGRFDQQMLGFNLQHWLFGLRGQTLCWLARSEEARGYLDRLLQVEPGKIDVLHRFMTHATYVDLGCGLALPDLARQHAERAAELARQDASAYLQVYAHACLGLAAQAAGEHERAAEELSSGLRLARERRTGLENEARMLADLAHAQSHLADPTAAVETAQQAIVVARRRNARVAECQAQAIYAGAVIAAGGKTAEPSGRAALERAEALLRETGAAALRPLLARQRERLEEGVLSR